MATPRTCDPILLARVRRRLFDDDSPLLAGGDPRGRTRTLQVHVERLIATEDAALPPSQVVQIASSLLSEIVGYGPLEPLLADPEITEIMVNGPDEVLVERGGRIERAGVAFADDDSIRHLIEKVIGPLGLRADESRPIVDARLADGSRFHAVLPPVALKSPLVTVRRFRRTVFTLDELATLGTLTSDAASWLAGAVEGRANICVSGGTSSGKTSLLNALSVAVPEGERIVTIEDAAELRLTGHVVGLEARPPGPDGRGAVTIRDLVRASLRLRPDRIVVGEVRDGAAFDMLQALNTGHDGSLTTLHANSTVEAVMRLETMCLVADVGVPADAARRQIATALDVFVHVERTRVGARRVKRISVCRPDRIGEPALEDVFVRAAEHGELERTATTAPPVRGAA